MPEHDIIKNFGRPSDYTDKLADEICARLILPRSLRSISRDADMPDGSTMMRWLGKHAYFREQYARARVVQADALFDESIDIADDGTNDFVERQRKDGSMEMAFDKDHVQRSKLRIETRRWMAGKLNPKKYGEKVEVETTGQIEHKVMPSDPVEAGRAYQDRLKGVRTVVID
jgi:hypothetical protein